MIFASPLANAQTKISVDKEALKKKVEKTDENIANPKKNTKASTWLDRGKTLYEVTQAPVKDLYVGMDELTLGLIYGKPKGSETVKMPDNSECVKVNYAPYFTGYMRDAKLIGWNNVMVIVPGSMEKAAEAYAKAYELDKGAAQKVAEGIKSVQNYYSQEAGNSYSVGDYKTSAQMFRKAFEASIHPAVNSADTSALFNSGFLATVAQDYDLGLKSLNEAKDYGFDSNGDVYYYIFHCYYGKKDNQKAMDILKDGVAKYPKNNKIVEGLLSIYAVTEGSDPTEIVPIVKKSIEGDPKNPELWGGLGRIYDKLNMLDESVEAFEKSVEFAPNDFSANFNLGLLYIKRGDAKNEELNTKNFSNHAEYNKALEEVNDYYLQAVAPLEKAYSANPSEPATVELLKNVCFRLRERDNSIMEKYTKYKAIFDEAHK